MSVDMSDEEDYSMQPKVSIHESVRYLHSWESSYHAISNNSYALLIHTPPFPRNNGNLPTLINFYMLKWNYLTRPTMIKVSYNLCTNYTILVSLLALLHATVLVLHFSTRVKRNSLPPQSVMHQMRIKILSNGNVYSDFIRVNVWGGLAK